MSLCRVVVVVVVVKGDAQRRLRVKTDQRNSAEADDNGLR